MKEKRKAVPSRNTVFKPSLTFLILCLLIAITVRVSSNNDCLDHSNTFIYHDKCVRILNHEYDIIEISIFRDGSNRLLIETSHPVTSHDLFIWDNGEIQPVAVTNSYETNATVSENGWLVVYEEHDLKFLMIVSETDKLVAYDVFQQKHMNVTTPFGPSDPIFGAFNTIAYRAIDLETESVNIYTTNLSYPQQVLQISSSDYSVTGPQSDWSGRWISWNEVGGSTPTMLYDSITGFVVEYGRMDLFGVENIVWRGYDCDIQYISPSGIQCSSER